MKEDVRENLTSIVIFTVIGVATGAFGLTLVRNNAASLDVNSFSALIIVIPCALMLLGSFAVTLSSHRIGRQLFLCLLVICLVTGIASMLVTSSWTADPAITSLLLANSEEGAVIYPILQAPVLILRDLAAYVVCPTVGSIAGAWLGSRLHPLSSSKQRRGKRR